MVANIFDRLLLGASFALIILTMALLIRMGLLRVMAVRKRHVRLSEVALDSGKYPEEALKAGKSFSNQFELPMLFYFGTAVLLIMGSVNWVHVSLAWAFVALRFVHAAIHLTSNDVSRRFFVYMAGVLVLTAFMLFIFVPILFDLNI